MTGRTGAWRDSNVLEGHGGPAHGPVAIVAGYGRRDVLPGFALHGDIVVALRTGARRHPIMGKEGRFPIGCPMATITVHRRRQMAGRFERGDNSPAGRVALHTLRGGSPKYALQVTPLTHNLRVAAAEREAGAAVIDFDIGTTGTILGRCLARQHEAKAQDQRD